MLESCAFGSAKATVVAKVSATRQVEKCRPDHAPQRVHEALTNFAIAHGPVMVVTVSERASSLRRTFRLSQSVVGVSILVAHDGDRRQCSTTIGGSGYESDPKQTSHEELK